MLHKMILFLFTHIIEAGKLLGILVLAFFAGEATEALDTINKYPGLTSALVGITIALGVRFIDKWIEGRNKTVKTADKVLELEHADKKELRDAHNLLMKEKETWWKLQKDRVEAELFEVRQHARADRVTAQQTNHAAINELMRLQNIVLGMQRIMVLNHLEIPEVAHIDLTKFMLPAWEDERDEQDEHNAEDKQP